jgi:hypothetical protein
MRLADRPALVHVRQVEDLRSSKGHRLGRQVADRPVPVDSRKTTPRWSATWRDVAHWYGQGEHDAIYPASPNGVLWNMGV